MVKLQKIAGIVRIVDFYKTVHRRPNKSFVEAKNQNKVDSYQRNNKQTLLEIKKIMNIYSQFPYKSSQKYQVY